MITIDYPHIYYTVWVVRNIQWNGGEQETEMIK